MGIEEVKIAAIDEILNPTFALTRQYLAVNKLVYQDELPVIEDVIVNEADQIAAVYFPVLDEDYYFVVLISLNTVEVNFMYMTAGNRVYLNVSSEEIGLAELIEMYGVIPTSTRVKGQLKRFGACVYKDNGFAFEPVQKKTGEVEDKLQILINALLPNKDKLKNIPKSVSACIEVPYYGYKEQMWGVHLDSEIIKKLADLGLEIDIDMYASGPDLPD